MRQTGKQCLMASSFKNINHIMSLSFLKPSESFPLLKFQILHHSPQGTTSTSSGPALSTLCPRHWLTGPEEVTITAHVPSPKRTSERITSCYFLPVNLITTRKLSRSSFITPEWSVIFKILWKLSAHLSFTYFWSWRRGRYPPRSPLPFFFFHSRDSQ